MQLYTKDDFLAAGSAQLPSGLAYRGVAIHPSSEVDQCIVGSERLSVGAVVPLTSAQSVKAVRRHGASLTDADNATLAADSGKLVLQLFEACDALDAPHALAPIRRYKFVAAADLSTTASGCNVLRVPFAGRRAAVIRFGRSTNAADLTLFVVGASWGDRSLGQVDLSGGDILGSFTLSDEQTWSAANAGIDGPTGLDGELSMESYLVGGRGDLVELYDELLVCFYGAAGGDAYVEVEAV